jgi:hypothetical protein
LATSLQLCHEFCQRLRLTAPHAQSINAQLPCINASGVESYKAVLTPEPHCSADNSPYSTRCRWCAALQLPCITRIQSKPALRHCCISARPTKSRGNAAWLLPSAHSHTHMHTQNHAQSRELLTRTPLPGLGYKRCEVQHSSAPSTHMLQQQLRKAGTHRWWRTAQQQRAAAAAGHSVSHTPPKPRVRAHMLQALCCEVIQGHGDPSTSQ